MRVQVLIKIYKNRVEIYGDNEEDFSFDIYHNDEKVTLAYRTTDDVFKPLLIVDDKDTLTFDCGESIYRFVKETEDRWGIENERKNKIIKSKRKYIMATDRCASKRGLFHNVQKPKEIEPTHLSKEGQAEYNSIVDILFKDLPDDYFRDLTEEEEEACSRGLAKMSTPTGVSLF